MAQQSIYPFRVTCNIAMPTKQAVAYVNAALNFEIELKTLVMWQRNDKLANMLNIEQDYKSDAG